MFTPDDDATGQTGGADTGAAAPAAEATTAADVPAIAEAKVVTPDNVEVFDEYPGLGVVNAVRRVKDDAVYVQIGSADAAFVKL